MLKADKYFAADQVLLTGRLSEFRSALQEEIEEIKNNGQNSTTLLSGHSIEAKGDGFWYRFFVEYMPLLPADTPCKLTIATDQYDVTVISSNENEIILSSKIKLPANIGKAKLENGSTVLMERLIKCIEDNAENPNPAGDRMFAGNDGQVYQVKQLCTYSDIHYAEHSNEGQRNAVKSALENDITYIWGPPGTGKTTVISTIINELFEHNRSVLIVSHTNTAVDGAIIKVAKAYDDSHKGSSDAYPILRLGITPDGFPADTLIGSHAARLGKELFEKKEALEKQQRENREELDKIQVIFAKDSWIKNNNLPELQGIYDAIVKLQDKLASQEKQQASVMAELDQLLQDQPNSSLLMELEEKRKRKKAEFNRAQNEITALEEQYNETKNLCQKAEDEYKKHTLYEELTLEVRRYMSVEFYKGKITGAETEAESVKRTLKLLNERKSTLQEAIHKYESKGAFAKLIAGKATYEQNQRSLSEVLQSINDKSETLRQKQALIEDYHQQLDKLTLLLGKRKAVTPSETKKYWREEQNNKNSLLLEIRAKQDALEILCQQLSPQISAIETEQNKNRAFFDAVKMRQARVKAYQLAIDDIRKTITKNQGMLDKGLADECEMCNLFYTAESRDNHSILNELSDLNDNVYEELHSIDIEEEKKRKESFDEEANRILTELSDIQNRLAELEKQAIMNAAIIGTTLAKSYLSDVLRARQFDTVILDEASMASIPALWCAAYLAEKNIVIVGDFLQLPPIVMAKTEMAQKWLGRDIFDHSGMQEMAKKKNKSIRPSNFVMLNEQYRMESDIAEIANLYYGRKYTRLKSYDMNPQRVKDRDAFYSWYSGKKTKDHIHLIDTESLHAWVTGIPQAKGHSRLNSFSAAIDVALAFKCLDKFITDRLFEKDDNNGTKVLIVAPYKPHVTLINKLIEDEYRIRGISPESNLVRAGTIHSFQGSEADIVIFDLVIDEPHYKAGLFLPDSDTKTDSRKMFNVAVTRAKYKLYVVGDFKYCQSRASNGNALSELLSYLTERYIKVDAKEHLLPKLLVSPQNSIAFAEAPEAESIFLTESKFHDFFISDIQTFSHNMIIYSPFMTENRLSILLPVFYAAIAQGKRIIVITKPLEERSKSELAKYKKCEEGLRNIGVSILHKKGMHEKIILVDDEVIWTGSLNALSYTGNTGEVMERRKDSSKEKTIINSYIKILDIDYLIKALDSDYETKCPICGGEMLIAESDDGGIYWKCNNGDYSRNKTQQYPVDGILRCPKCDGAFVFSMINKPRWVCVNDKKHFQYVKKNDLKLPNMAALLTQAERKKVQEYFERLAQT